MRWATRHVDHRVVTGHVLKTYAGPPHVDPGAYPPRNPGGTQRGPNF